MTSLWDPITVGRMNLPHRLAMAPMTRSRALADGTPGELARDYYVQRVSHGLLITEGVQPSDDGQGYLRTPGIYTDAHVEGWRSVISGVHEAGASMFVQLMHVGRMCHPDNTPHHRQPVAPSAIDSGQQMFTMGGMQAAPVPRALSLGEIGQTIDDFRRAAACAIRAGADGVEIHGANGYLVQQFFAPNANQRTDAYGGAVENRARFAVEVVRAIADEIGADRTAIRLSPGASLGGLDEGPEGPDLYRHLIGELNALPLAYIHIMLVGPDDLVRELRSLWSGKLLINRAGRPVEAIAGDVESGLADMVAVARWALANPDFPERLRQGAPLNAADPATFYSGGAKGYVDYPALQAAL